ncbi:MAG: putative glutamine amidotransferase class-I [Rhodocyclaceae bacterium]|nr:putative glutamine amidotransferase class-I [Rhodocyclaceae bacterium]
MRLVAVSQRVDFHPARNERRDALDQRLAQWLKAAGLLTAPVPNLFESQEELDAWLDGMAPAAVVLSGGNDLGEAPERDRTEALLIEHAARKNLPLLGICRGMQMMLVHGGGKLQQIDNHVAVRHDLHPESSGSAPWPGTVNSFHRWGTLEVPVGYAVLARAEDGSIEAVRHESLPWEGWMWHPERETAFRPADIHRLQQLIGNAIEPIPGCAPPLRKQP